MGYAISHYTMLLHGRTLMLTSRDAVAVLSPTAVASLSICPSPRAAEAVLEQADRRFPAADSAALRMARWDVAHRRAMHRGDLHAVRASTQRSSFRGCVRIFACWNR